MAKKNLKRAKPADVIASPDSKCRFDETTKAKLAPFLAIQLNRTTLVHEKHKLFEESVKNPQKVIAYVQNKRAYYERLLGVEEVARFLDDVAANRVALHITPAELMLEAQQNIQIYVEIFMELKWHLVRSRTPTFVTSDNPVFVRRRGVHDDPGLVGLERKDIEA